MSNARTFVVCDLLVAPIGPWRGCRFHLSANTSQLAGRRLV